jgi:hypothetical protein
LRRVQIEAEDVGRFGFELGIIAGHVTFEAVRFQTGFLPNPMHGISLMRMTREGGGSNEQSTEATRNARANGKKLGRVRTLVDRGQVLQLRERGQSLQQIATNLGIGYGTVRSLLRTH